MTKNRVLSLAEVLALEEGRRVWVEHLADLAGCNRIFDDGVHAAKHAHAIFETPGGDLTMPQFVIIDPLSKEFWPVDDDNETYFGVYYRVWSLPQPPTPDELAANPWPSVTE